MAPKKAGGKKAADIVDLPKASTLPDGQKNFFIGGWSTYPDLTGISTISDLVKPASEEAEATAPQVNILVLPGAIQHPADAVVLLTHGLSIKGLLPQLSAANKAAYEAKRNPKKDDGGNAEQEDPAANAAEGDETAKSSAKRKVLLANDAVQIHGSIHFNGIKPVVTVAPVIEQEAKKAAVPEKGAKKKTEEDKQRELEAQRLREEAALRAAKEEEERLSKFAIPRRWPTVTVSNLTFYGPVSVAGAHINFINCHFVTSGDSNGPLATNQVEVNQYCRVSFTGCTFAQPPRNGLYAFPLAEVTARNCVFSGIDQPHSDADVASVTESGPSAAAVQRAKTERPDAVGIHVDGAKVLVEDCLFEALGTGAIFRGKYALAAPAPAAAAADGEKSAASSSTKTPTSMTFQRCVVQKIFSTGIFVDKASGLLIQNNQVTQCDYYASQFRGGGRVQVLRNSFGNTVLVHEGSAPFLHSNTLATVLIDKNDKGNVYMEPKY